MEKSGCLLFRSALRRFFKRESERRNGRNLRNDQNKRKDKQSDRIGQRGVVCARLYRRGGRGKYGRAGGAVRNERILQVVRDDNYSRPFVGSCELTYEKAGGKEEDCGGFVAANFEEYFRVSEQLPTKFFVNVNTEKKNFTAAFYRHCRAAKRVGKKRRNACFASRRKNTKNR